MRIFLLLLLLMPIAHAEFLDARRAVIDTTLETSFTRNTAGSVTADVLFFPKQLQTQAVSKPQIESNAPASAQQLSEHALHITWDNPPEEVSYKVQYRVGTFSVRPDLAPAAYPFRLTSQERAFVQPTRFINSDDPAIKALARNLTKNVTDAVQASYLLAHWVRDHIQYNLSTLTEDVSQSASWTLKSRTGVCDELTVLFLALTRASGIPSRYVAGMAYTESASFANPWIPHAWAEVWLPETGWVPFDVTYGQFGWVDASHIVTKTSGDVDEASLTYRWQQGDLALGPMELSADTVSITPLNVTPLSLQIQPLVNDVYPGSVVPVKITARNPTPYWLPTTVHFERAPKLVGKSDVPLLAGPQSRAEAFAYIQLPDRVASVYDYSTPLIAQDAYGARATTSLHFGTGLWQITEHQARAMVKRYEKARERSTTERYHLRCSLSKPFYQPGEHGALVCTTSADAKVCLESCQDVRAGGSATFHFVAEQDRELEIRAEAPAGDVYAYAFINVAGQGPLSIDDLSCPATLSIKEEGEMTLELGSEEPVQDVFLLLEGQQPVQIEDFHGKQEVVLPVTGSDFLDHEGSMLAYVTYSDSEGVRYEAYETCQVQLGDIGALDIALSWLRQLFGA